MHIDFFVTWGKLRKQREIATCAISVSILVHTYVRSWSLGCTEVSSGLGRYRNRSATRKLLESLNTTVTFTSLVVSS